MQMTSVFQSTFQDEALVVQSLLKSAGIKAELLANHMLDMNPCFVFDVKGIEVYVPDEDAQDAKALVEDFRANKGQADNVQSTGMEEST